MLDPRQLRDLIVRPVLEQLDLYSLAAEQLVMGTAAQESGCFRYIRQHLGKGKHGRGRGFWQIEPATAVDLIPRAPKLASEAIYRLMIPGLPLETQLEGNLYLGAALCRLKYRDDPNPLPVAGDVGAMAETWKRCYNTYKGKGKPAEFVANWRAAGLQELYGV